MSTSMICKRARVILSHLIFTTAATVCLTGVSLAQEPVAAGKLSYFVGAGGSVTFGPLYDRARFGGHGTFGAAVTLAPGITEAFELVGSATGSFFPNDGRVGGDFLIANGGLEFRLVANLDRSTHYFFGIGGGISRVREKIFKSRITGKTIDGFVEWGPYFAPGVGFDTPLAGKFRFVTQVHYVTIFGNEIGNYRYLQLIAGVRL